MLWLQFIPHTLPAYTELYNIQGRGLKRICHLWFELSCGPNFVADSRNVE